MELDAVKISRKTEVISYANASLIMIQRHYLVPGDLEFQKSIFGLNSILTGQEHFEYSNLNYYYNLILQIIIYFDTKFIYIIFTYYGG